MVPVAERHAKEHESCRRPTAQKVAISAAGELSCPGFMVISDRPCVVIKT